MKILWLTAALLLAPCYAKHHVADAHPPWQGFDGVGQLEFATTHKSPLAHRWFVLGVKLMYAYEWPSATYAFRQSQRLEPSAAMGYWGEAMTHLKLIWESYNPKAAAAVLQRGREASDEYAQASAQEKMLIEAVSKASGGNPNLSPQHPGSCAMKLRRAMERVESLYPQDSRIRLLTGYAVIGTRKGIFDYQTNALGGNRIASLLAREPNNIGVLHFMVHAFENSVQSYRSREAAQRLVQVAPAAIHTRHMPAHYYLTQGQWRKVVQVNEMAWAASKKRRTDLGLGVNSLEFHGFSWLPYAHLQMGQVEEAYQALKQVQQLATRAEHPGLRGRWLNMRTTFLMESNPSDPRHQEINAQAIGTLSSLSAFTRCGIHYWEAWQSFQRGDGIGLARARGLYVKSQQSYGGMGSYQQAIAAMGEQLELLEQSLPGTPATDPLLLERWAELAASEWNRPGIHGVPAILQPAAEIAAQLCLTLGQPQQALLHASDSLRHYKGRRRALELLQRAKNAEQLLAVSPAILSTSRPT